MLFTVSSKKLCCSPSLLSGIMAMSFSLFFGGCAATPPPPPPDSSTVSTATSIKKKPASAEKEEAVAESTSTSPSSSDATAAAYLGANVGDEATKKAATECIKTKKFFDRAGAAPGKCSSLQLADIECTVEGLKNSFSSDADKKTFADLLAGEPYSGFLADQCIDCKGSSDELCKKDGVIINGMKILFVKEDAEVIKLKYMIKR